MPSFILDDDTYWRDNVSAKNDLEKILNSIILSNKGVDGIILIDAKSGLELISNTKHNNTLFSNYLLSKTDDIAASLSQIYLATFSLKHFSDESKCGKFRCASFYAEKAILLIYFFEIYSRPTYIAFICGDAKKRDIMRDYVETKINEIYRIIYSGLL